MADDINAAPATADVRPVVRTGNGGNLGLWAFLAILLLGGLWLFSVLNANRLEQGTPRTGVPEDYNAGRIASPAAPELPPRLLQPAPAQDAGGAVDGSGRQLPRAIVPRLIEPPRAQDLPQPIPQFQPPPQAAIPQPMPFDNPPGTPARDASTSSDDADRVSAGRLSNPSFTVPLGTVIPAVLESAIDSTRPGGVRALVQRDVPSFDGSRVLIQRGSRLYGEYEADLQRGQNRALVRWTRLLRPDGVTVALDSAASDPLGRAGIRGKVDSKFFQRFGNAILGSALDIGVGLATREVGGGTVVALPGSTQNIGGQRGEEIQPTLKVKHGTSISVYVMRDLDFSSTDG